jgi:hypothetical protein
MAIMITGNAAYVIGLIGKTVTIRRGFEVVGFNRNNVTNERNTMINNLKEFMEARGFGEESFEDIERATYKYTDCGAWITHDKKKVVGANYIDQFGVEHECEFVRTGITIKATVEPTLESKLSHCKAEGYGYNGYSVGSIVEGVDYDCDTVTITYPFELDEFWKALESVEDQANEIWRNTHGCDKCWDDFHIKTDEYGNVQEFGAWPINEECKTCEGHGTII